jgi:hypothetical protein
MPAVRVLKSDGGRVDRQVLVVGEVIEVTEANAEIMIASGAAEAFDPKAETNVKATKAKAEAEA